MSIPPVKALFLDIGGVLLTNGWGRQSRRQAAEKFHIDFADMDERHHLSFNTYEDGKLTLDQYLDQVIFYQPRPFSHDDLKAFIYAQSQPYLDMLVLFRTLKQRYPVKIAAVSNEGREITNYRIHTFHLDDFIDVFVISSHVHYRKPDRDMYALALDVAQTTPEETIYIDDRTLFIEVARGMGINSILHVSLAETHAALASFGLSL